VVLLLTLMVIAVLVVLVGQFSYSSVLDRKVARNHLDNAQTHLDVASASAAVCAYLDKREEPVTGVVNLTLEMEGAEIDVLLSDEQGKFNLNAVVSPPPGVGTEEAEAVFERVFKNADQPAGTLPAGLDESALRLVKESETPLYTLGALARAGEVDWETLEAREDTASTEGGLTGLGTFVTVWTDGRVNPRTAPDEVLLALANLGGGGNAADLLREKLLNPGAAVPPYVANAATRARRWVTGESRVYSAVIRTDRDGYRKTAQVVFRKPQGAQKFRPFLLNELE
jgi:hypothetical protein